MPKIVFRHCCIRNPSWAELRNFVHFLNTQLEDFEKSVYCSEVLKEDLPGFPIFVLRFLIQMSKVKVFLNILIIFDLHIKVEFIFHNLTIFLFCLWIDVG